MSNQYLDLLQSTSLATGGAATPANPYLDLLQSAEDLRRQQQAAQLTQAVKVNPDQYSAQRRVAGYLGYPVAAVEAQPSLADQAKVKQVQQATASSPLLQQRYTDADFAKLAHDDSGTLSQIGNFVSDLGGAMKAGVFRASRGAAGTFQAGFELLAPALDFLEPVTVVGGNPLRRLAEGFAMQGAAAGRTASMARPKTDGVLESGFFSGIESLTQNVLALPLAFAPGGQGAALTMMTAGTGGDAYQQAREKGLPMSQALPFAASQAAIEYATEKLPLANLLKDVKAGAGFLRILGRQIALEVPGEQIATVLQDLNEWAILNPEKPFSSYLEERPSAAAQTLVATIVGTGGNVAVAKGLEAMMSRAVRDGANMQQAGLVGQALQQAMAGAEASLLRQRSPEQFRALMSEMSQDGSLYIDAEVLNQMPPELLQQMPGVVEALPEALAANSSVEVKLADALTVLPGTPQAEVFMQNARSAPDAPSLVEAEEAGKTAAQFLQQEAERVIAQAQDQEAMRASSEAVRQSILGELNTAGRYRGQVNEGMASWASAFYTTMASRVNMTPEEFYQRYRLRVLGQATGQGEVLNAPAARELDRDGLPIATMREVQAVADIPTVEKVQEAIDTVGEEEFARRVETKMRSLGVEMTPEREAMATEAVAINIVALNRSSDVLEQRGAQPARRARPIPPEIAAAADVGNARTIAASQQWPTNRDFKLALQNAVRAVMGQRDLRADTPENRAYITQQLLKEAREALVTNSNAIGWYDEKVTTALEVVSTIHPELKTDEQAKFAFIWALAVTSNGVKVDKNFELAERSYRYWKDNNGRLPTSGIGVGPTASKIHDGLRAYNTLIERWGFERLKSFATTLQPNRNVVAAYGRKVSGEGMDTQVYGAGILGPKIGNGFFMNLYGEFGQLTMDRWWVRMWGRITGDLVEIDPQGTRAARDAFVSLIDIVKADRQALRAVEQAIGAKLNKGSPVETAKAIIKATSNEEVRDALRLILPATPEREAAAKAARSKLKDFVSIGDELRKAAKSYYGYLDGQIEVPGGSKRRDMMREVSQTVLAELQKDNPSLTMADFQALMWYPEKTLYDSAGAQEQDSEGYDDDEAPDYANAAIKLARDQGISDADINAAVEQARSDIASRQRARRSGRGSERVPAPSGDGVGADTGASGPDTGVLNQSPNTWQEDLPVVEDGGNDYEGGPAVFRTFHGTTYDDIEIFRKTGNAEGYLGEGPYFSTSAQDASDNYAGVGPDLTVRIEREKEQISDGFQEDDYNAREILQDYFDANGIETEITDENLEELKDEYGDKAIDYAATQRLKGKTDGLMMPVLVKLKNPADTTGKSADLTYEVEYNDDGDVVNESGTLLDWIEATNSIAEAYGFDASGYTSALLENWESIGMDEAFSLANRHLSEAYDDNGNMLTSGAIFREIAEEAGYDGVIMDADLAFGSGRRGFAGVRIPSMSGVEPGTLHIVPFKSNQIKSVFNTNPTDDPNILKQGPRGTFNPRTLELVLSPTADLSTFFHETGHFFLEVLADIASQPGAPVQIVEDMNAFLKWSGVPDLATWNGYTLEQKRPYHERWAESIEQYVMEGKAPNAELQPLMRRFRAWLLNVYQSIKQFMAARPEAEQTPLNDDIRRVMDRMLATDEQIQQANEVAGLVPDEQADGEAAERLQKRSMADLKWAVKARDKVIAKLKKEAREVEKTTRAAVTAEVEQQPLYRAIRWLKKGETTDPVTGESVKAEKGFRLNTEALAAMYPETMLARPDLTKLRGMTSKDGLAPETVADMFGYETADQLVRALVDATPMSEVVDALTEQRMLEENGDLIDERAIQEAANEAVHNEARARSLATELRTQQEMLGQRTDTGQVNARGARITVNALIEAAKQFGANVVARTSLRDLKATAWKHTAAERRAGKRWQEHTAKGETADAVKAKQDQVLNNAAAKAALDATAEAKKILEFFKRVTKGNDEKVVEKGRDPDIVNAARAVLAAYGIETPTTKRADEYLEIVQRQDPDAYNAIAPMVAAATQNAQPLEALTFEELQGLHEAVQAMWLLAKSSREMEVDGDRVELDDAEAVLYDRMEEIGVPDRIPGEGGAVTAGESRIRKLRELRLNLTRVEQWAEAMDGKAQGPFWRYVFLPIKAAADRVRERRIGVFKRLEEATRNVAPAIRVGKIEAPEIGYVFGNGKDHNNVGMAELLPALMNVGNESNKRKLLLGRGWATETNGVLDTSKWDAFIKRLHDTGVLTKEHWDYVQTYWDVLESLKKPAQEAHRQVYGRYFSEVTAAPVETPFGTYRGGYYPAQTDTDLVTDMALKKLAEAENENMSYSFPSVGKGFTESRVEAYTRPLKLDINVAFQHVDKVILFAEMQPAAQGVGRLLRRKKVSQPLERIMPGVFEALLVPWSNDAAKQITGKPVVGDGGFNRGANILRARVGMQLMMGNFLNAAQQVSGIPAIAAKLEADGLKRASLRKALVKWVSNPKKFSEDVWAQSTYMKDRAENEVAAMADTMKEIMFNPTLLQRGEAWTRKHAYFLQTWMDNRVAPIAWQAGYDAWRAAQPKVNATSMTPKDIEALEARQHRDAVLYADGLVRQTQGSQLPEDVSRFERGIGFVRLFTQFAGYFNTQGNTNAASIVKLADQGGLKKNAGRGFYVLMMGLLAPIWIAEAVGLALRGGAEDDDEDGAVWDDWLRSIFGMGTFRGLVAMVPGFGQVAVATVNRFNDNPADDRISASPVFSAFESLGSGLYQVGRGVSGEEVNVQKMLRDFALVAGTATGLPLFLMARPVGYAAGVAEGRIEPTSAADAARGLVTGTASPESKAR